MSSPTVMTHQYDDNEASQELFQEFFTRTPNKGFAMGDCGDVDNVRDTRVLSISCSVM